MSNIYKLPTILISTFLILCFVNIKESSSKILDIKTPAKQVIIYDHEVDEVLFEKNADQLMKPASMAKVMTSYILFDRIKDKSLNMSDTFLVSDKALRLPSVVFETIIPSILYFLISSIILLISLSAISGESLTKIGFEIFFSFLILIIPLKSLSNSF